MKVITPDDDEITLGTTEATPTISMVDYSRRVTDDFGTTTVVPRGFSRRLSVRIALPFDNVTALQDQLAALRATPATWIADDDLKWLQVEGFYKDFSIDLNVPPVSFCTLTVEGLAETETVVDAGGDPAPAGRSSSLMLVQPLAITPSTLASVSVPETEWPDWAIGATYFLGSRVIRSHRVFESLKASNIGHDPILGDGWWLDIGPTNAWAMFDEALGTATTASTQVQAVFNPIAINAVAVLDAVGSTVRVQAPGYDQTAPIGADGKVLFLDLPVTSGAGNLTVTITGTGEVSVGTLMMGTLVPLGVTEASPTAGITDYSRKETDDFGGVTVVERSWSKKMAVRGLIRTDALDLVANRIAAVRTRPSLWIGDDEVGSLIIYGFFKDFSIERGENVSTLSLSIEGLSKASALSPAFGGPVYWADIQGPNKPDDNADVTADNIASGIAGQGPGATAANLAAFDPAAASALQSVQQAISNIADDNLISTAEKWPLMEVHRQYTALFSSAKSTSLSLAISYPDDPTSAQRTTAQTALDNLNAYLAGLTPPWSDPAVNTPVDGGTLRAHFQAAATTVAALMAANINVASQRAQVDGRIYDMTTGNFLTRGGLITALGISAGFTGQGPGATASGAEVLNFRTDATNLTTVARPEGGAFNENLHVATGALQIELPISWSDSMLRFYVDVFDYADGGMQTYLISGYSYDPENRLWYNCSAQMVGGSGAARPIRFGVSANNKSTIWIGDAGGTWSYPQFVVRDVQVGFYNTHSNYWKSGWVLSRVTSLGTVRREVLKPVAGDMIFGQNAFESWGGPLATKANFKTAEGVSAGFAGQGALATLNSAAWGTHITNRPAELTDGRITAGLDGNGMLRSGLFGGADTVSVSSIISQSAMSGTQLAINPEFALPLVNGNGVYLYDNAGAGKVGLTRISGAAAPNSSKMMLVINYDGTGSPGANPTPGFGGFTLQLAPAAVGEVSRPGYYARNSRILFKIVADIPVGRALGWASNQTGSDAAIKAVTSMFGVGAFKEYIFELQVGTVGEFSSTGYFYVFDGPNTAFSWSVAKADAIDVTGAPRVTFGQSVRDENGVARGGNDLITQQGISAGFTGQGWAATQGEAATSNALVPVGSNVIVNSSFQRGLFNWGLMSATNGSVLQINLPGFYGVRDVAYIFRSGATTAANYADVGTFAETSGFAGLRQYALPVRPGDRVGAACWGAHHRSSPRLILVYYGGDGQYLSAVETSTGSYHGGGANGDLMGRMSIIDTAPAGARFAALRLRMWGTGEESPYFFFSEPWLGILAAGQTQLPPYSPGPPDFRATLGSSAGTDLFRSDGSTVMSQAEVRTPEGVSAGFVGQGWGATADQKALDNNYVQTVPIVAWGASVVSGNTLIRSTGTFDYGAAAYANRINGPCFVSVGVNADAWHMVNLDDDLASGGWQTMKAAVHYHPTASGGLCTLYVDGVGVGSTATGLGSAIGSDLTLVYDGSYYRVFVAGAQIHSTPAPANLLLYPVWHAYEAGVRYWNLKAGPGRSAARIGSNTYDAAGNLKNSSDLVTVEGISAGFTGQGPGATASAQDVLNYHESGAVTTIRRPGGGVYSYNGGAIGGAVKVALPLSNSHTMIRFYVDIYDYQGGGTTTYLVAGYPYADSSGPQWEQVSAQLVGSSQYAKAVRFGHDGTTSCVWIGDTNSYWAYPQVTVRDFQAGYNAYSASSWNNGWSVSLTQTAPAVVNRIVQRPVAGDAIMGENVLEAPGTPATNANYKTNQGIAAGFTGQGALASRNSITLGDGFTNGFGSFAALSQINAGNITTYIANQAIGSALIANASIGTAHIDQIAVSKIAAGSLDALSGTIGLLRTRTTGARLELASNEIRSYHNNGQLAFVLSGEG